MRTPLLLNGLLKSDLPISRVDLFDLDDTRLQALLPVMRAVSGNVGLRIQSSSEKAIQGSDFVLVSIRVGGMAQRAFDETVCMQNGVLGQETVGPAGFAKAMRTIPPLLEYARQVERLAPLAYMINFSNPVGIVSQAVNSQSDARMIGICDTPTELFEEAAAALGVPSRECFFDFFGLNHLGWLRDVHHRGISRLDELLDKSQELYRAPFFAPEFIRDLRLLPTEYCYFYYSPERAIEGIRRAGHSRGAQLEALNAQLFEDLRGGDSLGVYTRYLDSRNSSYMQSEVGRNTPSCGHCSGLGSELTGYDNIALSVLRAIHFNLGTLIPLNVPNRGNIPELEDADSIEVPCVVDSNGAHPLHVGYLPEQVRPLLVQVKEYERLTVRASMSRNPEDALTALNRNPLVANESIAAGLVGRMRTLQ